MRVRAIRITDAGDARLDDFRDLTDADVRPDRRGVVIAEGVNVVERLVGSRCRPRAVLGVADRVDALEPVLAAVDAPVYVVDKWTLSDVVGFRVTRGVLAAADRPAPIDVDAALAAARRVAVLESLNDFENLGSVFRNAAAFGIDLVLLDERCADPLYRRSVRVSMGHALRVPFAVLPAHWPGPLTTLAAHGLTTLALTPEESADSIYGVSPPPRWAVLVGAEGPGLTPATLAAAHRRIRIPMAPGVDSLNVATAAAVAFSHLTAHADRGSDQRLPPGIV